MAAKSTTTTAASTAAPNIIGSTNPPDETDDSGDQQEEDEIDDSENAFFERLYSYHKKPDKPVKIPLPDLPESKLNLLRDHVRIINGKSPKHRRQIRIPCWMDSPEFMPKSNRTFRERGRYVRSKLEDRKDSEEDVYSSRCLL